MARKRTCIDALGVGAHQPRPALSLQSLAQHAVAPLGRGFAQFEAWRDDVLEQEELERHKLDRKIAQEEHWLRYGVTARRKRNVKRLAHPQALRGTRPTPRGPTGQQG